MSRFELSQLGLLVRATRFEWPGAAIVRKTKSGSWVVTDWEGCRTSRHPDLEGALKEAERLCAAADERHQVWVESPEGKALYAEAKKRAEAESSKGGTE